MEHTQAKDMGAAEKYLLGQLSDDESADFEAHFFECRECAEEVKSTDAFIANAKAVLAETKSETGPAPPVEKAGWLSFIWPAPAGALAAAALAVALAGYQALVVVPRLQTEISDAESLQAAPWSFLSVARSETQVVRVPRGTRMAGLTLSRSSDRSFPHYRCEVQREDGHVVTSAVIPARGRGDELEILLPVSRLEPGPHVLVVSGLESASAEEPAGVVGRYPFTLEYSEEE